MLGFFFRHYDPFVDRYIIYDDGSTDGSREILTRHPNVEVRSFQRVEAQSFVLSHKVMQDEAWKASRGHADWVIVTAIDEHLHLRDRSMVEYLAEQRECGVTLIPALGFDMNAPKMPSDDGLLVRRVTNGRARIAFNKLSIFDPNALRETGFGPGRHLAEPDGELRFPSRDTLMLWHYKHLGFERNASREAAQALRLGTIDVAEGYGQHYLWTKQKLREFWNEMESCSTDLAADGFEANDACVRPLWWEERSEMTRVEAAPLRPLASLPATTRINPMVSVLVKTYNHAAYVRQTIESVLDQSFQDFEIVVTDDGSTDGTLSILKTFVDPRIKLEAHPRNLGISTAMNTTIARASGRYLAILNSDDWALPGRLRRQVEFLEANPQVSLVFGQPRTVGEGGLPTPPFNDFTLPLRFPDFSRRTWLRQFFFHGNCLCAPTAMIRREAYDDAGTYDPRLTNLQDLDMWIRMLIAGHNISMLSEPLSAFRIRADNANASAPSEENRLRSNFEASKVLEHFAVIDEPLYREVFSEDLVSSDLPIALRIAELAQRSGQLHQQNFALNCLYEFAEKPSEIERLRDWSGSLDISNIRSVDRLNVEIRLRDRDLAQQAEAAAVQNFTVAKISHDMVASEIEHRHLTAELQNQILDKSEKLKCVSQKLKRSKIEFYRLSKKVTKKEYALTKEIQFRAKESHNFSNKIQEAEAFLADARLHLAATIASRELMRKSLSWRSTYFLRWIGRAVKSYTHR
nr:glycosyltransferase [Methylobacterium sp. BTF04]